MIVESERVGRPAREGVHYRVRWEDGHESTFFPSAGSATIIHKAKEAGVP